jgi:predicted phosphate transport protein (TIGR00153 family)
VRLIPRDEAFFDMFEQLAERISASAKLLRRLFSEPGMSEALVSDIKTLEHEADELTREIISRIDQTFVTPIDREDIHLLTTNLDDVIDLLDGAARRTEMYHLKDSREPAIRMCDVLVNSADHIYKGVRLVRKAKLVAEHARSVKLLEEEGDAIYREAMQELFAGSPDPMEVIKWKDVYDKLEDAIDRCEDVANVLESIALKHS